MNSITVHSAPAVCPRPAPPALALLDEGRRLTHPANLAALTRNVDLLAGHIRDQDAALDCYEAQARPEATWE